LGWEQVDGYGVDSVGKDDALAMDDNGIPSLAPFCLYMLTAER